MSSDSNEDIGPSVVILLFTVFLAAITRNAWLSDDAFITLRTVDNFVHGFGLRYNLAERVQAFTHPLWAGFVSVFYVFTREAYYTLIALSFLCSAAAVYLVAFRLAASRLHAVLALALLAFSKAFVDFSTSGLENPLTHLLLAVFAVNYLRGAEDRRSLAWLALIAALGVLNRMDTALLFFPPLLFAAWTSRKWRGLSPLCLGMTPFVAWELFSLFYYGFPFPNTAYAKLGSGIARSDLVVQGLYYFVDSLSRDPLTLIVVFAGLATVIARRQLHVRQPHVRQPYSLVLASGPVLYLGYVLWIGGDFMSGRFFSAVYFLAVVLLSVTPLSRLSIAATLAIAVVIQLGVFPAWTDSGTIPANGIVDERAYYARWTALADTARGAQVLAKKPPWEGVDAGTTRVRFEGAIGLLGFTGGPGHHLVDFLGLTDPLLARLPAQDRFDWRIGHFERKQPTGYLATLRSGENRIADRDLATYYDHLSLVVRGDLLSWRRMWTILAFNLGRYDALVDEDFYGRPDSYEVRQAEMSRVKPEGFAWDDASNLRLAPRNGVMVRLESPSHCRSLHLGLSGGTKYRLTYYSQGRPVPHFGAENRRRVRHTVPMKDGEGLRSRRVTVPGDVADHGFDALLIFPFDANRNARFSLGYLRLCEE